MTTRHPTRQRPRSARTHSARLCGAPLAAACLVAVLAGCGSDDTAAGGSTTGSSSASSPSASSSAAAPSASTAPVEGSPTTAPPSAPAGGSSAGPGRCTTDQLALELRDPGEGAGQRYVTVVLTNRGTGSCRIDGYGGVGLVDSSGRALPTEQVRDSSAAPQPVDLAPGSSAVSRLQWTVVPGTGDATDGPCQPEPADLQVIPPDERAPLSAGWSYGPVCSGGRIDQQAYRAG